MNIKCVLLFSHYDSQGEYFFFGFGGIVSCENSSFSAVKFSHNEYIHVETFS